MTMRVKWLLVVSVCVAGVLGFAQADEAALANDLANDLRLTGGVCVVVGAEALPVAQTLASQPNRIVHMIDSDPVSTAACRDKAMDLPEYGRQLVVEAIPLSPLPYADNMVDLLVAPAAPLSELVAADIARVLRPNGKAWLGGETKTLKSWLKAVGIGTLVHNGHGAWVVIEGPELAGVDDWTHWQHGLDNNPVSTDQVIRAPYRTQWFGTPYYIAMPSTTVAAGGRVFVAMGHIAHHEREERWLNTLIARNGYNGSVLWMRKLPEGYMAHRSAFIATDDVFYLIDDYMCVALDPATGHELKRFSIPGLYDEWKWMALDGDTLYVMSGKHKDDAETTVVRSGSSHWSWGNLSPGYYTEEVPWGHGDTLTALDIRKEKPLWQFHEEDAIDSRGLVLGDGKLYYHCPNKRVAALDVRTGRRVWLNESEETLALIEEPGKGLVSTPGFRSSPYTVYAPGVLVFQAQTRMNVIGLSADDGHQLWVRSKISNNPNVVYMDGGLYVGIGESGITHELDPLTGETKRQIVFAKTACARLTGTPDSLFARGAPDGFQRYDLKTNTPVYNAAVRPGCTDGAIGANGLLYVGPWLCDCNLQLMGTVALTSADGFRPESQPVAPDRLRRGPAFETVEPLSVTQQDWPTYRANDVRSAASLASVADTAASERWTWKTDTPVAATSSVTAGGLAFFGARDGFVRAIDMATGKLGWKSPTAGPILQPPTVSDGRLYVGSGDGRVYALEAKTGRFLWSYRVAPAERRVMIYDALCSAWPVNSGVVVKDGIAYAAAGIIDYDGTYVCALDAETGDVKWENNDSSFLGEDTRKGVSVQGNMLIADGVLWLAGGNITGPAAFDLKTGEYLNGLPKRVPFGASRGKEIALLPNGQLLVGGKLLYSADENVVNPGMFFFRGRGEHGPEGDPMLMGLGRIVPTWTNDRIFMVQDRYQAVTAARFTKLEEFRESMADKTIFEQYGSMKQIEWLWATPFVLGRMDTVSMALAPNALVTVAQTDAQVPHQKKWFTIAIDPDTGKILWHQALPSPAQPEGLSIDRDGRILVTLADGSLVCMG